MDDRTPILRSPWVVLLVVLCSSSCGLEKHSASDAGSDSADQRQDVLFFCDIASCGFSFDAIGGSGACGAVAGSCLGDGDAGRRCTDFTAADVWTVMTSCANNGGMWATTGCQAIGYECIEVRSTDCIFTWFADGTQATKYCSGGDKTLVLP